MNLVLMLSVLIAAFAVVRCDPKNQKGRKFSDIIDCGYGFVFNGTACEECGLGEIEPNVKIVGGIQAIPFSWPSQALIIKDLRGTYKIPRNDGTFIKKEVTDQIMCGGTLINSYTVLTASHCLSKTFEIGQKEVELRNTPQYPKFESRFTVYLGIQSTDNLGAGVRIGVLKAIKHEFFNPDTLLNDIALLILTNPATTRYNIKPACLPRAKDSMYPGFDKNVYAAGWGAIFESGPTDSNLNNVKLTTYNPIRCSTVSPEMIKNWNAQICAGNVLGGKDTCQGDSGGGLYAKTFIAGKERNEVIGIVSYGVGCARPGLPGIYTRTSFYMDWIKANWRIPNF